MNERAQVKVVIKARTHPQMTQINAEKMMQI